MTVADRLTHYRLESDRLTLALRRGEIDGKQFEKAAQELIERYCTEVPNKKEVGDEAGNRNRP
jgi:hypothetical protein